MLSHVSAGLWHLPEQEPVGITLSVSRRELCSQIVGAGMKEQAQASCAPPPTCFLCLDKNPKTIKKAPKETRQVAGAALQGSSPASTGQGFPPCVGTAGAGRWPRPLGELVAGPAPSLPTGSHRWESRGEGITLGLAAPWSFLSQIAGWVRKGGSLTIFQGLSGQECGHVSPSSPICQNARALWSKAVRARVLTALSLLPLNYF